MVPTPSTQYAQTVPGGWTSSVFMVVQASWTVATEISSVHFSPNTGSDFFFCRVLLTAPDVVVGVVCGPDTIAVFCPGKGGGGEKEGGGEDEGCEMHFSFCFFWKKKTEMGGICFFGMG